MKNKRSTFVSSIVTVSLAATLVSAPSIALADSETEGRFGYHSDAAGSGVMTSLWDYQSSTLMSSVQSSPVFTPKDDTIRQSNTRTPTAEADHYVDWAHCAADSQDPDVPDYLRVAICAYPPPEHGEDANPQRVPTTREILLAAATLIHADGAGLHKRPSKVSFTNKYIPTIDPSCLAGC